jgi:hypothetical protein
VLIFALAVMSISLAYGCDCRAQDVDVAAERAEVVFRGSIIEFRPSSKQSELAGIAKDTKAIAVFCVTRVWKGEVGQTFEMPALEETLACWGFWPSFLKLGSDLIVYARRFQGGEYVTSICSRTQLAKDAKNDLKELGPGEVPKRTGSRKEISF